MLSGNVSKYGNHVTLGSKRVHKLSDELLAAEEKKIYPFFIKTEGRFGHRGWGQQGKKNSFIEFIYKINKLLTSKLVIFFQKLADTIYILLSYLNDYVNIW